MAQYHHLKVYRTSFDLLVMIVQVAMHFQREFRYTLGERLQNYAIDFIVVIYKANSAKTPQERATYICDLIEKLQYICVVLQLSCELKNISKEKYIDMSKLTQDIEKQLNGWLAQTRKGLAGEQNEKKKSQKHRQGRTCRV